MKDLIEMLENAKGPDRELDVAIGQTLFGHHYIQHEAATNWDSSWRELVDGEGKPVRVLPAYTASIEAALTLLPENHYAEGPAGAVINHCYWEVWGPSPRAVKVSEARAASPALAIAIGAIKARAALDNYEPPDPPGWEGGFAENH